MLTRCLAIAPPMKLKFTYLLLATVPLWLCSFQQVASAQFSTTSKPSAPTPTNIRPVPSSATRVDEEFNITGGQLSSGQTPNVIHQFLQFDVGEHDSARFIVDSNVNTVVGLIDALETPSIIDGTLAIVNNNSANLVLVNPAGIVFGKTANLLLPGNLTAAASSGLLFEDQYYLSIDGSVSEIALPGSNTNSRAPFVEPTIANLTGDPTGYFLFEPADANPNANPLSPELPFGSIHNQGSLDLLPQSTLTLVGQYVQNDGDLETHGGRVNLVAATGDNLVRLSQANNILALDLISTDAIALRTAADFPQALTGGEELGSNQIQTDADGSQRLVRIPSLTPAPGRTLVRGTIDVSDSDGQGTVNIAGESVYLIGSDINANGVQKAGDVFIGADVGIPTTDVIGNRGTNISVDSDEGEGGVIQIRATETVRFYGNATADGANSTLDGTVNFKAGETPDIR